ncbi:MAG: 50S ribosomal protein L19 [Planctomycetes bacterium]|nr:50S ribosomal protein L19 [Planctomycetota bacterium]
MDAIDRLEQKQKKEQVPDFRVGDVVDVHVRIKEGDKERVQIFTGTVIARKGAGYREAFTVRRIVSGEGVERIFPLHAPNIVDVVVRRPGRVRRAKLYYLRDRVGKATKVKERRDKPVANARRTEAPPSDPPEARDA